MTTIDPDRIARLPLEVKSQLLTQDIKLLDRYCQTSSKVRLEECPRLYAQLLWDRYRLKVDTSPFRAAFRQAENAVQKANLAHREIHRLRQLYFAETARLENLDRVLYPERGYNEPVERKSLPQAALRFMRWDDPPSRRQFNIDYEGMDEDGFPKGTLLYRTIRESLGVMRTRRRETPDADVFDLLLETYDDVRLLVATFGAAVKEEDSGIFSSLLDLISDANIAPAHYNVSQMVIQMCLRNGVKVTHWDLHELRIDPEKNPTQHRLFAWLATQTSTEEKIKYVADCVVKGQATFLEDLDALRPNAYQYIRGFMLERRLMLPQYLPNLFDYMQWRKSQKANVANELTEWIGIFYSSDDEEDEPWFAEDVARRRAELRQPLQDFTARALHAGLLTQHQVEELNRLTQ